MILKAAKELFYERSFAAVGSTRSASARRHRAGDLPPLPRQGRDPLDAVRRRDRPADGGDGGAIGRSVEELEALVRGHAEFVMGERKLAGVKIREERSLAEPFRRGLHRRERRYIERWTACLARCYPDLDVHELTTATHVALRRPQFGRDLVRRGGQGRRDARGDHQGVLRGLRAFEPVSASA